MGETAMQFATPDNVALDNSMIVSAPSLSTGSIKECNQRYVGKAWGVKTQRLIDAAHFLSAGVVSFARGLNDTPKIVPLMLGIQAVSMQGGAFAIALFMAIGGWLNSRRVAETMSKRITAMNAGQGFTANLITGILVIAASRFGLPVSTTHVSVGSIFGVGLISRQANSRVFTQILLSWILTLPIAATLSAFFYSVTKAY